MTAPLFPAPSEAASLFPGAVMHARLTQPLARFAYRVFCLLIDIDRLAEADRTSRVFSVGRFNLFSFEPCDHGALQGDLRRHVDDALVDAGLSHRPHRVLLLCYPRFLGFVFNPLSIFFAYNANGDLIAVVYEVRNTHGQRHSYVAPIAEGELDESGVRQERDKIFFVSPFQKMALRYKFRVRPPTHEVAIRILEVDRSGPVLAATFSARREKLTTAALLKHAMTVPLLPIKVLVGIHWQALKLWLRGAVYGGPPRPPERLSANARGEFSAPLKTESVPPPPPATSRKAA